MNFAASPSHVITIALVRVVLCLTFLFSSSLESGEEGIGREQTGTQWRITIENQQP